MRESSQIAFVYLTLAFAAACSSNDAAQKDALSPGGGGMSARADGTGGKVNAAGGAQPVAGSASSSAGGSGGAGVSSTTGGRTGAAGSTSMPGAGAGGGRGPGNGNGGSTAAGGRNASGGMTSTTGGSTGGSFPTTEVRTPLPCFADDGVPAGSAIDLQMAPSRITGVAPLSVYFDTVGTTADATMRPFHELGYCWDFDDANAGAFATTGVSKNQAKGPIAAHVFEKPGTYTVTVSARDAEGRIASRAVEITVTDPEQVYAGNATVCFSGTGDFTGCPSGAQQVKATSLSSFKGQIAANKRLLLHRGETFASADVGIGVSGPGTIGAYGTGDRPKIDASGVIFSISSATSALSDWRIMDLDIVGNGPDAGIADVQGYGRDLLFLRVKAANIGSGINASASVIDYLRENGHPDQDLFDLMMLADCEVRDLVGGQGHTLSFISAHRLMLLGNIYQNAVQGEHVLRSSYWDRGVLSNNDMGGAPPTKHVLKLHAPEFTTAGVGEGKYSERIVISDNIFHATGGHDWTVAVSPQNANYDERIRDVIIERNLFTADGAMAEVALEMSGENMTVRDNIFDRGPAGVCVEVTQRGIEPVPTGFSIVNNTCYSDGTTAPLMVALNEAPTVAKVFNNLVASTKKGVVIEGNASVTEGGNMVTTSPGFAVSKPTTWKDFELVSSSPAIDAGDLAGLSFWDFSGQPRPEDAKGTGTPEPDVGAFELAP